jgi:hypothetical protein
VRVSTVCRHESKLISHQIPLWRIWLDQIDERVACPKDKQELSYAVGSQHHANLRLLMGDLGISFSTDPVTPTGHEPTRFKPPMVRVLRSALALTYPLEWP